MWLSCMQKRIQLQCPTRFIPILLYFLHNTLYIRRNVNTAPQPFPDTLSHANVLHSALERLGEGQESHPMSTSEPHFIEEQPSLPTSLKEFSSLQFTQAYSDQSSDATPMQDIPSHSSDFHSQMTSVLSSIMILITSSQLELKHSLCKKLQHSLHCSISQWNSPHIISSLSGVWEPSCQSHIHQIWTTIPIPCSRDIVESYTIPIITIPHPSMSKWSGIQSCSSPSWLTYMLPTFGHVALHYSYRQSTMSNCTLH